MLSILVWKVFDSPIRYRTYIHRMWVRIENVDYIIFELFSRTYPTTYLVNARRYRIPVVTNLIQNIGKKVLLMKKYWKRKNNITFSRRQTVLLSKEQISWYGTGTDKHSWVYRIFDLFRDIQHYVKRRFCSNNSEKNLKLVTSFKHQFKMWKKLFDTLNSWNYHVIRFIIISGD